MKRYHIAIMILILFCNSCDRSDLPQVEYFEEVNDRYIPVFVKYRDGALLVNDTVIKDIFSFRYDYIGNLPGFEYNTRHCQLALDIPKETPFREIDSLFMLFDANMHHKIFFLVNNPKDTVGFSDEVPLYESNREGLFRIDTFHFNNILRLSVDTIFYNYKAIRNWELKRELHNAVYDKEQVIVLVDSFVSYEQVIKIREVYNRERQHFKEIYSEYNYNKKYSWLQEYGVQKYETDKEYSDRMGIYLEGYFGDKTIMLKEK